MKKSALFLLLALTVPAGTALIGVAAGVDRLQVDSRHSASEPAAPENDAAPMQTLLDQTVAIDQDLEVSVANARFELDFDPQLVGEAKVKAESRSPGAANADLTKSSLSFSSSRERSPIYVTLTLPASFGRLVLTASSGECKANSRAPLTAKELTVRVDGGTCEFRFKNLEVAKIAATLNAGKLDLNLGAVATGGVEIETNAGQLVFFADTLTYDPVGSRQLDVRNNAGNTEIHVQKSVAHRIDAQLQVGRLDVSVPGEEFALNGLSEHRRVEGPPHAPSLKVDVNAGKSEIKIDQYITP